jgi:hypothetical protein
VRNDLGLLAEEYDPISGRQLGNFPQTFPHIGLVNSAVNLSRAIAPLSQPTDTEPARWLHKEHLHQNLTPTTLYEIT